MEYLLLIYSDEKSWDAMPKAELDAVYGEYMAFTEAIRKSGHYKGGNPLRPTATATQARRTPRAAPRRNRPSRSREPRPSLTGSSRGSTV